MTTLNRILIADDDPVARENLRALLFREPYELVFAVNGQEAIEYAISYKPDLILLDVMMPGLDGFTVCRRLRGHPYHSEVPIILITALDDREARREGFTVGADDFLSKPFDRMELRVRIRGILRLNRYRRLLAERLKFERVVASTHIGIILVTPQQEIVFANPKACFFLGIKEDEPHPMLFQEIVSRGCYLQHPDLAWQNWPEPYLDGGERYLVQPETPIAHEFWLQVKTLDRIDLNDEINWIISLDDVSSQIATIREYERFHMIISHKLRTPLTSLLSSLELISMESEDFSVEEIQDLGRIALRGARRLRDDIHDILQFIQSDKSLGQNAAFALAELPLLIAQLSERWTHLVSVLKIDPVLESAQLPLPRAVMELIFYELLENATKFHPQHQPQVQIVVSQHGTDQISIVVQDDGVTLSMEQLTNAWKPYYQGDKFLTGQIAGMGLGLPLVASYVWRVGGNCYMANRSEGSGVVITLLLPVIDDGNAAA